MARHLAKQLGTDGLVIVALSNGQVGSASYGSTVAQCRALVPVVDQLIAMLAGGEIDTEAFSGADDGCPR
jgi:hypothetical protein